MYRSCSPSGTRRAPRLLLMELSISISRTPLPPSLVCSVFLVRPRCIAVAGRSMLAECSESATRHARQNHRALTWLAPTSYAEIVIHSASHPMSASSPTTREDARSSSSPSSVSTTDAVAVAMPATFSRSISHAPLSVAILTTSKNRPLRFPSRPALRPAIDKSWHGNPAMMQSTLPRQALASNVVTSGQIGAASKLPSSMRATRTADA